MPRIDRLVWSPLGDCRWRSTPGHGVAVWPSPVGHDACFERAGFIEFADTDDAWDADFAALVDDVVALLLPFGAATVYGIEPVAARFSDRLRRRSRPPSTPAARLALAARDDQFGTCEIDFGDPVLRRCAHRTVTRSCGSGCAISTVMRGPSG